MSRAIDDNGETNSSPERQIVVFNLGHEEYGLEVQGVREIIRVPDITRLPNAPDFVAGLINVRGKLTPVMDLRRRFDMTEAELTGSSRIIVVHAGGESTGLMVDGVTEVLRVSEGAIEPASEIVASDDSRYLQGIANLDERLIIILDVDNVLSGDFLDALAESEQPTAEAAATGVGH